MSMWAAKRRLTYFLIVSGFFLLAVVVPFIVYIYEPPTCFDGVQNQGELGVDCSGPCPRLCSASVLPPIVHWQRFFEIVPTVYSAVARIENPNLMAGASDASYSFKFFDDKGVQLEERTGTTHIPPRKTFAIFEHSINILGRVPTKVLFEFTSEPEWNANFPPEPIIPVARRELTDTDTTPRVIVTISNPFVYPLPKLEVTALIFDIDGNAIAASQTFIDGIPKGASAQATFTWPRPFPGKSQICENASDVVLAIDRSGSMDDDSQDPPQPLTDVKQAAISFVNQAKPNDQIGVVSFANAASHPPDVGLSSNLENVRAEIAKLAILTDGPQNTNIGDGLEKSLTEVRSPRHISGSKPVIVLLTDGAANVPELEGDSSYPEQFARGIALQAKNAGVEIYTIGLGNKVSKEFLKSITSGPNYFFSAADSGDLSAVYKSISSAICRVGPAVIEIITRVSSS